MTEFLKDMLKQPSTKKGIALIGSTALAVLGYGDVISFSFGDDGLHLGGMLGTAITAGIGLYEVGRNENKGEKPHG